MRVRYGKPVKVKSLVGNQFEVLLGESTNADQLLFANGYYAYSRSYSSNLFSNINLIQNHKYYCYCNGSGFSSGGLRGDSYIYEGSTLYLDQHPNFLVISDTETHSLWTFTLKNITNLTKFYIGKKNDNTPIVNYWFLIDLTDIFGSGKEPTTQEFYNKYNKYFPLIATGEEITIDSKAGQIAYKNLEEDSIRCKVAGGSSDIYYGYNQLVDFNANITYSGSNPGRSNYTYTKDSQQILTLTKKDTDWSGSSYSSLFEQIFGNVSSIPEAHKVLCIYKIKNSTQSPFAISHLYNNTIIYDHSDAIPAGKTGFYYEILNKLPKVYWGLVWDDSVTINIGDELLKIYLEECSLIDLTDWFGVGKEPSTVVEFKEKFNKEYYGFCPTPIKLTKYQIEALPSYGYNQLLSKTAFTATSKTLSNVMLINNGDGSYTLNGTATARAEFTHGFTWVVGNYYYVIGNKDLPNGVTLHDYRNNYTKNKEYKICSDATNLEIDIASGTVLNNVRFYPQIINITDWYGAGNEPTTIEEFKATFPNKYYPHSKKRLLNKYMINKLIS